MKKLLATILIGVTLVATGCSSAGMQEVPEDKEVYHSAKLSYPNVLVSTYTSRSCFDYVVDKDTGVVYLFYRMSGGAALTVMLDRDGLPVTAEQLGIEY